MSSSHQDHIDAAFSAALAASAPKAMYGGATATGLGWWLSNDGMLAAGLLLALAGFFVNLYFKVREDRRQQREEHRDQIEHDARMRQHRRDSELMP